MSKFTAMLAAKRESQDESQNAEPTAAYTGEGASKSKSASKTSRAADAILPAPDTIAAPLNQDRKRGRPNAKRSDPEFVQTTAYIRKKTHKSVKRALLAIDERSEMDFSELVEDLLAQWLAKQT